MYTENVIAQHYGLFLNRVLHLHIYAKEILPDLGAYTISKDFLRDSVLEYLPWFRELNFIPR